MTKCPTCLSLIPDTTDVCPSCGADQKSGPTAPTLLEPSTENLPSPRRDNIKKRTTDKKEPSTYESLDGSRFVPGTMLEGRYRIVGLIGRGGMGEVYRADDLKLGQTVALKFLPRALASDRVALTRFHREVRVARHVSHRNVCRVYDIGETDGNSFLSMEFVKGEELSSLLRRIGRLPHDKALEISRQLCAGLAAAHDNNVLHRDLKPANVMIDGEGNVRILDFGLAGIVEEFGDDERNAGTPAYMAPEQLAGEGVTKQSDIYALGLVLYEIFTGKRAYEAKSVSELLEARKASTPTNPSHIVKDIDPLVERVILRCLEHDAHARPTSAIQVAAMLPGGDPLAAALAAGETPSPEMVAAAPKEGLLRPTVALSLVAATLVLMALATWLAGKVMLYRLVPLEKSAEVLQERAREIARKAGYTAPPLDSEYGFFFNSWYLDHVEHTDKSTNRWDRLGLTQPPGLIFWYRQSPRYLEPMSLTKVEDNDPPIIISGMTGALLDTRGRLKRFYGVPPQKESATTTIGDPIKPDWSILFKEAGLEISNFKPTESQWTPPHAYDTRSAWEGVYPEQSQVTVRVEAASYRGKPVYFELIDPWDKPARQDDSQVTNRIRALYKLLIGMALSVIVGGVILAVRNIRLGRGDRKGAFRIALFVFFVDLTHALFSVHHVATFGEWRILMTNLADALFTAALFWVLYVALEPFVRRRWPGRIISWTRLIVGDFRNPLIGRDILIGAVAGTAMVALQCTVPLLPGWLGLPGALRIEPASSLLGLRYAIPVLGSQISSAFIFGFGFLCLLLLLSIILRNERFAIGALWVICSIALTLAGDHPVAFFTAPLIAALMLLPLVRYGLLAMMSAQYFHHFWISHPMTFDLTAWYGGSFAVGLVVAIGILIYSFFISIADQPIFGKGFLED